MDQRARIHVHSRTHRLSDCDGRDYKAAVDGIVSLGILTDDSAVFVKEVCQTQEKVAAGDKFDNEETIITLTWDD